MKKPACCFTGHRPQQFHFGYDEDYDDCFQLKIALACEIRGMVDNGVTDFLTGMSIGVDMWCAEIVQSFQEDVPDLGIELTAVIPFEGQANKWSSDYRDRYFDILAKADHEIVLNRHYNKTCMRERNRYMVDNATHMIAVFDGSAGRTKDTLEYARSKNLSIITIDPRTAGTQITPPLRAFTLIKGKKKED